MSEFTTLGTVPIGQAEVFQSQLTEAIELCKKLNKDIE